MKLKLLIIYFFLLGCSTPKGGVPEGMLPEKEMISILKEVHLAEANFDLLKRNSKVGGQKILLNNYQEIYNKYDIDENQFKQTLEYYGSHPQKIEQIYSRVLEEIMEERSMLDH